MGSRAWNVHHSLPKLGSGEGMVCTLVLVVGECAASCSLPWGGCGCELSSDGIVISDMRYSHYYAFRIVG